MKQRILYSAILALTFNFCYAQYVDLDISQYLVLKYEGAVWAFDETSLGSQTVNYIKPYDILKIQTAISPPTGDYSFATYLSKDTIVDTNDIYLVSYSQNFVGYGYVGFSVQVTCNKHPGNGYYYVLQEWSKDGVEDSLLINNIAYDVVQFLDISIDPVLEGELMVYNSAVNQGDYVDMDFKITNNGPNTESWAMWEFYISESSSFDINEATLVYTDFIDYPDYDYGTYPFDNNTLSIASGVSLTTIGYYFQIPYGVVTGDYYFYAIANGYGSTCINYQASWNSIPVTIKSKESPKNTIRNMNRTLVVNSASKGTVEIIDVLGRVKSRFDVQPGKNSMHISTPGVYFVRLTAAGDSKVKKIIVE